MNNLCCLILMFFTCRICSGQNLVINESFEDTITCSLSTFPYAVECAPPWYTASGTPDYGSSTYSCASIIPPNNALAFGYQYPRTGNSHIGCGIWLYPLFLPNCREYFGAELIDTLKANHTYRVEFYVSLANTCRYATDDIGVHFSDTSTANPNLPPQLLPLVPQVVNFQGNILSDTLNWMLVSETFIANGGEKFMTIGNFFNDSITTVVNVYPSNPYLSVYYFIDDVSVVDITVGMDENNYLSNLIVYPNPICDNLNVITSSHIKSEIIIYDVASRKLLQQLFTSSISINTEQLAKGIYIYEVRNRNGVVKKGKVLKD